MASVLIPRENGQRYIDANRLIVQKAKNNHHTGHTWSEREERGWFTDEETDAVVGGMGSTLAGKSMQNLRKISTLVGAASGRPRRKHLVV